MGRTFGCFLRVLSGGLALLFVAGPAGAAEIEIGGYAKLDLIWTDKIAGGGNGSTAEIGGGPASVPLDADAAADQNDFNLEARQSRFNFTATGESAGVRLKGFIEADFFTDEGNRFVSNSRRLRLRHAYGEATLPAGLVILGGQTWSTFMNTDAELPDTIDFNGPAGQLFSREPQLRVGFATGPFKVFGAIESHAVSGLPPEQLGQSQEFPLLVLKGVWAAELLTAEVAGALARNRAIFDGGDDTTTAWGLQASVAVPIGPLTLRGHIHMLDGLNRLGNGDFPDAGVVDTSIENVETLGWYAAIGYTLSPDTQIIATVGWGEADDPVPAGATGQDETLRTLHVTVLQKLWGNAQVGIEYQRAEREQFDGAEGDFNRIQAAWWYFF